MFEIWGCKNPDDFLIEVRRCMAKTDPNDWCQDVVRSKDGKKNCFFGHLFAMGKNKKESNLIWNLFEWWGSSTYWIYGVNDGKDKRYPQKTAKERCLAFLDDLISGKQDRTYISMEKDSKRSLKKEEN